MEFFRFHPARIAEAVRTLPLRDPASRQAHLKRAWLALVAGMAIGVAIPGVAWPHDAPTGWTYPYACCSGMDCRPVSAKWLKEQGGAFVIPTTGENIPYTDRRVRNSPDGDYHWCSVAGKQDGRTICLFVPPRGF